MPQNRALRATPGSRTPARSGDIPGAFHTVIFGAIRLNFADRASAASRPRQTLRVALNQIESRQSFGADARHKVYAVARLSKVWG
jgi:hypothetical protein